MPKKGKHTKNNKSKQNSGDSTYHLFTMGELDLIFKIQFKDEDLEKSESNESNNKTEHYKLEDLNELKDLAFLGDNEEIWEKIKVEPANENLKLLLTGSKNTKKKCQIDYICFGRPQFEGDEEFFEDVFDHVTSRCGLNVNKTPLDENGRYSIKIEMKFDKQIKVITLGNSPDKKKKDDDEENKTDKEKEKEKEKEKNEENEDKGEGGEEEEEEEEDYEENEAMKLKKIPKFKRSKSVLCKLDPASTKYAMVYLNYEDIEKIPGDFKMGDLVELLTHFKKKNSTIFINYYKKEMTGDVLPQEESRQQDNKNQPKNENENKEEEKKEEENKEEEKKEEEKKEEEKKEEEKKEEENKEEEKKEEEKKEEEKKEEKKETKKVEAKNDNKNRSKNDKNKGPSKEMKILNKLYYTTDIYFFDTEQAVKLFDKHYKAFTTENPKKNINKSKVYDYFIQGIASGYCFRN